MLLCCFLRAPWHLQITRRVSKRTLLSGEKSPGFNVRMEVGADRVTALKVYVSL
jgi:hypothetical protein